MDRSLFRTLVALTNTFHLIQARSSLALRLPPACSWRTAISGLRVALQLLLVALIPLSVVPEYALAQDKALFSRELRLTRAQLRRLQVHKQVSLRLSLQSGAVTAKLQLNETLLPQSYRRTAAVQTAQGLVFQELRTDVRPLYGALYESDGQRKIEGSAIGLALITEGRYKGSARSKLKRPSIEGFILAGEESGETSRYYSVRKPAAASARNLGTSARTAARLYLNQLQAEDLSQALAQCGTPQVSKLALQELAEHETAEHRHAEHEPKLLPLSGTGGNTLEVEIAFDADYEYFKRFGSDSGRTISAIESIMTAVDAMYREQLGTTFRMVHANVWATEEDPYTETNHIKLLNQFSVFFGGRDWTSVLGRPLQYDLAHLMTGRDIDGSVIGVAWLSAVCGGSRYALSQYFTSDFNYWVPLTAHEIGHNLGTDHDECKDKRYVMCPSLNMTREFSAFSINAMSRVISQPARSCLSTLSAEQGPPLAPKLVTFFDLAAGKVGLSFVPATNGGPVAAFEVFRSQTAGARCAGTPLLDRLSATRHYEDLSVEANRTYYYSARSISPSATKSDCSLISSVQTKFEGAAPVINAQPNDFAGIVGDEAYLYSAASGSQVRYQWFRNQAPIEGATKNFLPVELDAATHGSQFYLEATNPAGTARSATATAYVISAAQALRLESATRHVRAIEGEPYYVHAGYDGSGPINVRWLKNGEPIEQGVVKGTWATLSAKAAKLSESGATLRLEVSNSITAHSLEWKLEVFPADGRPVILEEPIAYPTIAGETAYLYLDVRGEQPLKFQWFKDGEPIHGKTEASFDIQALLGDKSVYSVQVSNSKGSVVSLPVQLRVEDPATPFAILQQPESQSVSPGARVKFEVKATGIGRMYYRWFFNGVALDSGPRGPTLELLATPEYDGSRVKVEVSQSGATAALVSEEAYLRVLKEQDLCPEDPQKTSPGVCGCGVSERDTDGDGLADCIDACSNDPAKTAPGACGCGQPDSDRDLDGMPDCRDQCPSDKGKVQPGVCGCGVSDLDSDADKTPDCLDSCPTDRAKLAPGQCGCGVADTDSDRDGTADCRDQCPSDPSKLQAGICGCGRSDVDSDQDGTADCRDGCATDSNKTAPGLCGCGTADTDGDKDGTADCRDLCPSDPTKIAVGICGCGVSERDTDQDGTPDCKDSCPLNPKLIAPGQCGCENQCGEAPVIVVAPPQSVALREGETLQLNVEVRGTAPIYYQWFFQDKPIVGATTAVLLRENVGKADAGLYFVRVKNALRSIRSANTVVTVEAKPSPYTWKDYSLSFSMLSQDDGALGVAFRYKDPNHYYRFSWDKQQKKQRLMKVVGGVSTVLSERSLSYQSNRWYRIDVFLQAERIGVFVEGELALEAKDNSLSAGTVAFYSAANSGSAFDDLKVYDVEERLLLESSFEVGTAASGSLAEWQQVDQAGYVSATKLGTSDWQMLDGILLERAGLYAPGHYALLTRRGSMLVYSAVQDSDRDGLSDAQENELGTNPSRWDTDLDGLSDGEEYALWGATSREDIDRDGLGNIVDPDSDGDGYSDGVEESLAVSSWADKSSVPFQEAQKADLLYRVSLKLQPNNSLSFLYLLMHYRFPLWSNSQVIEDQGYSALYWYSSLSQQQRRFMRYSYKPGSYYANDTLAEDNAVLSQARQIEVLAMRGRYHVFINGVHVYRVETSPQKPGPVLLLSSDRDITKSIPEALLTDLVTGLTRDPRVRPSPTSK
jgi:hypothetical protein